MARTVKAAFDTFRGDAVDLDPDQTAKARSSRDYLVGQLPALAGKSAAFPPFTSDCVPFGSFARKTKIRPLDDVDLMPILKPAGVQVVWGGSAWRVQVTDSAAPLAPWADNGYVNSRRLLNSTKSGLASLASYSNAELHRNLQAVTLKLTSYTWNFDIVPSLRVSDGSGGTAYFLIPDGQGEWMKSDPRKAQERVTALNQAHSGQFIPAMRLLKSWKKRKGFGSIGSFAFEVFAASVFDGMGQHGEIHLAFGCFFDKAPNYVFTAWMDPAGFSGDLGAGVPYETKLSLQQKLRDAAVVANAAYRDEYAGKHEAAIAKWQPYLGSDFPAYG